MHNFWNGFEKRADFRQSAMNWATGLFNRAKQSGVGQAIGRGVQQIGNAQIGGIPLRAHAQDAVNTLGRVTGVQHLRQGSRQMGKLMNSGAINEAGQLVNPRMQGAAAAASQNLITGAKRLGGTALAAGGTLYAGKKIFGGQPQQPQQSQPQPQAMMPQQ